MDRALTLVPASLRRISFIGITLFSSSTTVNDQISKIMFKFDA